MERLLQLLSEQFGAMSVVEVFAVLFAVLYLVLAIRQNIYCWLCAILSASSFVYLYFTANLYMESLLNIFYVCMAIYGWIQWRSGDKQRPTMAVTVWPIRVHAMALGSIIVASAVCGYLLATKTDAAYPYVDSATTFSAIWATFLVARKVLENWWYWLVIDLVSVFIYWTRGLELTAFLFVIYVALIPIGLLSWSRSMRATPTIAAA